jgi:hypothetical protein
MKIPIGNKFYIESDKNQFILYAVRKKGSFPGVYEAKEGETTDEIIGYYSTLMDCLKAFPSRMLMRSSATSLSEVVDLLERYRLLVESGLKGA